MKPAAVMGSLVDVKNVNTHKSVRLTIDIPAEQAMNVFEAFGWPTMVAPVPVAIARLAPASSKGRTSDFDSENGGSIPSAGAKERKRFSELPAPQQAGMLCAEMSFRTFLREEYGATIGDENDAAGWVRTHCDVRSRSELTAANSHWRELRDKFQAWKALEHA